MPDYNSVHAGSVMDSAITKAANLPAIASGDSLKFLRVNSGETAHEHVAAYTSAQVDALLSALTIDDRYYTETEVDTLLSALVPVGTVIERPTDDVPSGFLEEDGSNISMTTYEDLYDVLGSDYGLGSGTSFTADSSTDVLTTVDHGLSDGDVVELSNSGGALPSGLAASTKYYVVSSTTNTFQLSLTLGGSAVDFTSNGTGTHSWHTEFLLRDRRGLFTRGWDHGAGNDPDAASRTDRGDGTTGDYVGTKQADEYGSHSHTVAVSDSYTYVSSTAASGGPTSRYGNTGSSGGNETRPKNINTMYCIKY